MRLCRLFADDAGESHFEEIDIPLSDVSFAPPAPPFPISEPVDAKRTIFIAIPAGFFGDWHKAPARQLYIQLSGELEVQVSDGERRRFAAGDVVLVEDTSGRGHVTTVVGDRDVEAVFVQLA